MKKVPPIVIVILLARLRSAIRTLRNVASRVGILRLGFILLRAAWFQLQLSGIIKKPERLMVSLRDSGKGSLDQACASVGRAELTARARQVAELWYEFQAARESSALESIQDLFAVVLLSARMKFFSLVVTAAPSPPFADLGLATLAGEEAAGMSGSTASLMELRNSNSHAAVLTKPLFQSEIAPNDYLKRAADGRKVVLVSVSDSHFSSCWRQLLGNTQKLTGEEAGALFVLLDRPSIPDEPALPAGIIVQPLDILGFTRLERLALARNVDFLVTDHTPYVLAALAKNPTIISPVLTDTERAGVNGDQQGVFFKVSRPRDEGREVAELKYDA